MNDDLLTVIVRLHNTKPETLSLLGCALFSLVGSNHEAIEPLVVTQNFSAEELAVVQGLVDSFAWSEQAMPRVLNFQHENRGKDHRSALINLGLDSARGRYIAFLDYDDYVYEHAYELLIARLRQCESAVACGGVIVAHVLNHEGGGSRYVRDKKRSWTDGSDQAFIESNAFPIHSFVIDRGKLHGPLPRFDEELARLEDFHFLLRLRLLTTFDLHHHDKPLVEYALRVSDSGINEHASASEAARWDAARKYVQPLKEKVAGHAGVIL